MIADWGREMAELLVADIITQSSSWYVSVAEVVAKVLFAVIHFFLYRKKQKHAGWRVDHA